MRRLFIAGILSSLLSLGGAAPAQAMVEYCDWDPPVLIVTPGGNLVAIHDSVWTSRLTWVGLPLESHRVSRATDEEGNPVTDVDMTMTVPGHILFGNFPTLNVVATGALGGGQVLAIARGQSGQPVHLHFRLDTP